MASDYEKPILISVGDKSTIISAVITEVDPKDLAIDFVVSKNCVNIKPVLLNPKDSVTFKFILLDSKEVGEISVSSRIVGVKSIKGSQ